MSWQASTCQSTVVNEADTDGLNAHLDDVTRVSVFFEHTIATIMLWGQFVYIYIRMV